MLKAQLVKRLNKVSAQPQTKVTGRWSGVRCVAITQPIHQRFTGFGFFLGDGLAGAGLVRRPFAGSKFWNSGLSV